jgi:H+/Cl- antiporter ClcA/CBS domain-containing protein
MPENGEQADSHPQHPDILPVSPALAMISEAVEGEAPVTTPLIDAGALQVCGLAIGLGVVTAFVAQALLLLIALFTNLAFFQRWSFVEISPAENTLGLAVIFVPVIGALIVGFMARYGSKAIRGHGIPEAMEQVLTNKSRIPARITILKPLSSAISIGTGGPFGAEGPIIATGGAIGSVLGQFLPTTPAQRKTLLAAGAAAGMAATFGSPLSALLLAIELLLFEFRPRSLIPVALASVTAASVRMWLVGSAPVFLFDLPAPPPAAALVVYVLIGALLGLASAAVTRIVYAIEDAFERLPIHWMWWPAIGAVAVGIVGYFAPRTLGVGYENISELLSGNMALNAILFLCGMKFISWSIALGSGTSGGTLAPLLTIGGGLGAALGILSDAIAPGLGVHPGLAALIGMSAMFAGATRAPLASAVFAFETTLQPFAVLPLLTGCVASYLVSCRVMQNTIMTEKIARRGIRTPGEYIADPLDMISVQAVATKEVVSLQANDTVADVRAWLASGTRATQHQGFPVVTDRGVLVGVLTQRDLRQEGLRDAVVLHTLVRQPVKFVYDDCSVRQAVDHMVNHDIGRLPVVSRRDRCTVVGIVTRSDILAAHRKSLDDVSPEKPSLTLRGTPRASA